MARPLVHLELHTGDARKALAFYVRLFGWAPDLVESGGRAYQAMGIDGPVGGGVVECSTPHPLWLPYVEVPDIGDVLERARGLGARVALEPREGPAGTRSVLASPSGGEVALWQPRHR